MYDDYGDYGEHEVIPFVADPENVKFLEELENTFKVYYNLAHHTSEERERMVERGMKEYKAVDLRPTLINLMLGLFRRCNLSQLEIIEYLTLVNSFNLVGYLRGDYEQQYMRMNRKINKRIRKLVKQSMEC
jgi:hypothetical protein